MTQPWEETLSVAHILQLHADAIAKYGGQASPPKQGCLEQCLGNAWTAEMYLQEDEGVPLGLIFAARLFFYLINDHCFVDGNKRIGWSCLVFALLQHGLSIEASEDEAVNFTLSVAESKVSAEEVASWVADRLVEA